MYPQLLKRCVGIAVGFYDADQVLIPNPIFNYMSQLPFLNVNVFPFLKCQLLHAYCDIDEEIISTWREALVILLLGTKFN
jgi:hypothetical protein